MEAKHQHRLHAAYPPLLAYKRLHCLEIPDDYRYMDAALVAMLDARVTELLSVPGVLQPN